MATQHTIKNKSSQDIDLTLYNDATGSFYQVVLEPGDSVVESDSGIALIPQINWLISKDLVSVYPAIGETEAAEWNKWFSRGIRLYVPAPEAKSYVLDLAAPFPYSITKLHGILASGTCKITVRINGVDVPGLKNVDLSSTIAEAVPTSGYEVSQDDLVQVLVSSLSSPVDLALTLRVRKDLS